MIIKIFIVDLINFIKIHLLYKKNNQLFFFENNKLAVYLNDYVIKRKCIVVAFEKIYDLNYKKNIFFFRTKFFQILFFLTVRLNYFICTTPDLENSYFVKSKLHSVKYIYIQHSHSSLINNYHENAFTSFDAIQVINSFQLQELFNLRFKKMKKFKIFKSKYNFTSRYSKKNSDKLYDFLIAPTWSTNFYTEKKHEILIDMLNVNNFKVLFRPHYMSIKKKETSIMELKKLGYEVDLNNKINFFNFENLITDLSGIAMEFLVIRKKKVFLVDSIIKKRSNNYSIDNIESYTKSFFSIIIDESNKNFFKKKNDTKIDEIKLNKLFFN